MQQNISEQTLVVLLDDMTQHSIPRLLAIRDKLRQGQVLSGFEVEFFRETMDKVNRCDRDYPKDPQCEEIFTKLAHLIAEVVQLAQDNEQEILHSVS